MLMDATLSNFIQCISQAHLHGTKCHTLQYVPDLLLAVPIMEDKAMDSPFSGEFSSYRRGAGQERKWNSNDFFFASQLFTLGPLTSQLPVDLCLLKVIRHTDNNR